MNFGDDDEDGGEDVDFRAPAYTPPYASRPTHPCLRTPAYAPLISNPAYAPLISNPTYALRPTRPGLRAPAYAPLISNPKPF